MPKKLGTRIASGLIAALMFMQTISTSVVTAYAADVTSGSDVVSSDVPSDTSTANTLNDSSGSEGEQTPNDESQAPEESGNDESSSATQEPATSEPTAVPVETATPTPEATEAPDATNTPTATPEPTATATPDVTATPEPSATPTPTPTPESDEEEVSEALQSVLDMMEQLPESVDDVAEYDEAQCVALRQLCDQLQFAIAALTDEEAVEVDLAYVDELYAAVMERYNSFEHVEFNPLAILDEETDTSEVNIGDEVTFSVSLNRDDVAVQYQWQKMYMPQGDVTEESVFNYTDADGEQSPTWYNYLVGDMSEAELLNENPDATWQGMELWLAARDALEVIGETADSLTFEWKTRNFALEGFAITAAKTEDGAIQLFADKDDEHYVASLNDEGAYAFTTADTGESITEENWVNIEGATESTYTHVVDENDRYTTYRCQVTIVDETYLADLEAYKASGSDEIATAENAATDETETDDTVLYSTKKSLTLPETTAELSQKVVARFFSMTRASASGPVLSNDAQWVVGVNSNYEYITADMYAMTQQWLSEGRITQQQADMYWTKLEYSVAHTANVIDKVTGLPTGATRQYIGFTLTDGNKMEVLSDWYGKTVYFRQSGTTGAGTAIEVPAKTSEGQAGEQYKRAVTIMSAYIGDAGTPYRGGIQSVGNNCYYDDNTHITMYTVEVNKFNADPDKYLMDAEGNYRMDSFTWGPGVYDEPDISGKAFWALQSYIAEGYGMMIGHDTMYGYAGAYTDAWGDVNGPWHYYGQDPAGNWHYPGDGCSTTTGQNGYTVHQVTLENRNGSRYTYHIVPIDPNDTATRYYNVNQWNPNWGHWNMNALMGQNNANTESFNILGGNDADGGDYEFFMAYSYGDPYKIPSKIMSSGGSHLSPNYKTTMYGSNLLRVRAYPYSHSEALNRAKYRTPTNYPYDFVGSGETFNAMPTHSNMQVAFGTIWVDYANNSASAADGNGKLITPTVDGKTGTNNFYLAGDGNFLMNQIGHLPENRFTDMEAKLLVNTIMYISQRKQCEVCQSEQNGDQMSHFVHRINNVNAKTILDALANGGSFWYPLDDCYMLTNDLNLAELYGDSWAGIKNFMGHFSADTYTVTLPNNGAPLFVQDDDPAGKYNSGNANGWNLGSSLEDSAVQNVVKTSDTGTRTTGIARVLGYLPDLFDTTDVDYTGYTIHIYGKDNEGMLPADADFSCVVNSDDKYIISNLPPVYAGADTIYRARVYDRSGNEVTQYGPIIAKVPRSFWDTDMTVPLELIEPEATPIADYRYWEGPTDHVMTGSAFIADARISDSDIVWYYRIIQGNSAGNWVRIGNPGASFTTSDGAVTGKVNATVYNPATESGIPATSSDVALSFLAWTGNRIQLKTEYTYNGKVYTTIDEGVAVEGANGYIDIEQRPMYVIQAFDKRVNVASDAEFVFEADFWKGLDEGLTYEIQYRGLTGSWKPIEGDSLFPDGSYEVQEESSTSTQWEDGVWVPTANFWKPETTTPNSEVAGKHTTIKLTLLDCPMDWDSFDFRVVFRYQYNAQRTMQGTTDTANNQVTSRTGHLIVVPPTIKLTDLKAQALLLNESDPSNGNVVWTSEMDTPPNDGRATTEVPLDTFDVGYDDRDGQFVVTGPANDNKAVYTTKITFTGNKDNLPTITWQYQNDLNEAVNSFHPVGSPITPSYDDVGEVIGNLDVLCTADGGNGVIPGLEEVFLENGTPYYKFKGYITLDAVYPTDPANQDSDELTEWNLVTSLHIDSATNPMDFGSTHFYFNVLGQLRYIKGWDGTRLKSYCEAQAYAFNFNRDADPVTLYEDPEYRNYGAELVLDYNISIRANDPNKNEDITTANGSAKNLDTLLNEIPELREAKNSGAAIYNYKLLDIIAPNGLRYAETYFIAGHDVNDRSGIHSRDTIVIDHNITDASGHNFDYYFGIDESKAFLNQNGQVQGIAFYSKSGNPISKNTWQWFWRNAIYYVCYDGKSDLGDQVYFYIDEQDLQNVNASFGANNAQNPYSEWTAPIEGTYEITLYGGSGGGEGGTTKLTIEAEEGAKLYFVAGGAGGPGEDEHKFNEPGNPDPATGLGGYNGGGNGGIGGDTSWATSAPGKGHSVGAGGGGATTVAVGLMGTGRLIDYQNQSIASQYILGVAGGGAGSAATYGWDYPGMYHAASSNDAMEGESILSILNSSRLPTRWLFDEKNNPQHENVNGNWIAKGATPSYPEYAVYCNGGPNATHVLSPLSGGNAGFALGTSGGNFSGIKMNWNGHGGPRGGGGGWFGGWANNQYYVTDDSNTANCNSSAGGGTSYVATTGSEWNTDTGGKVKVISTEMITGGNPAFTNGSATIRMVDFGDRRFKRNGKNAFDTAYEDTGAVNHFATVKISAANKVYDGQPNVATVSVVDTDGDMATVLANAKITYSNNYGTVTQAINASTDAEMLPLNTTGSYAATVTVSAPGYTIEYVYENTIPGFTYASKGLPASGDGDTVYFDIYPRGLDVAGSSTREYNGMALAKVTNLKITDGIVPGDTVSLAITTAFGYFVDDGANEWSHVGKHNIDLITQVDLVNSNGNYYVDNWNVSGEITARPLHLHSLYHDTQKYSQQYDVLAQPLGEGKQLTDTVSYNDETMTVEEFYDTLLAGERVTTDITRYMADQFRNYEEQVKEPNNYRGYDNTTDATISNISLDNIVVGDTVKTDKEEYAGTYATMNAGEELVGKDSNGDNGTIKPSSGDENRYWWLDENVITRTEDLTLVNNEYGDYYIADEDYSGAIYRAGVIAMVKGQQLIYGEGLDEVPYTDDVYTSTTGSNSWLTIAGLMGADELRMEDWTGKYKNEFKYDLLPEDDTPVGDYPITYIGLNEDNFPVLSNYIVQVDESFLNVNPRPIRISVNESLKDYGDENPAFTSEFSYKLTLDGEDDYQVIGNDATDKYEDMTLVAGDTIADVLEVSDNVGGLEAIKMEDGRSNIPYLSDAETNSDVIYVDEISETCEYCSERDGKDRSHFHLGGYAVWVNDNAANGNTLTVKTVTNMYGEQVQNYSLNYVQNILKIHPLSITIIPDDKEMVYGTANEPALTYTLEGRRVKWDDLSDVKLVRDAGRDVYDGYVIRVDSYNNSDNYMVDVETGIFKITPAYLMVTPDHHTKYYGDPAPDWSIGITGFKYDDTVDSVFVDGRNAGRVVDDGFDYIKASVGDYTFNVDETSLEMIPNQFGNYNYVITQNPSSLRIIPRPITIEAGGWSKPYGTPDPEHTVLITDDLTGKTGTSGTDPNVCVDPENAPITFDLSRADGEEVGVYPIYVSAAEKELGHDPGCHGEIDGLNTNYTITYIPDNDIIYRADELIGIVSDHTRYYGNAINNYIEGDQDSITYYIGGTEVTPEEAGIISDPNFQHTDLQTSSVGSYAIYATGVESSKYDITLYPGYVTVIPRPVTVIAQDNEKIYGDADPTIDFIIHDGHSEDGETYYVGDEVTEKVGDEVRVQPDDLPGDVQRQPGEDVGVYDIDINNVSPYSEDGKMNYDIRFVDADFTIKPATLLVQVMGGYKKTYGEENPTFGANITGFKREDTAETVLTGEVGFATISTVTTPVGKYIVSAKPEIELEDGQMHRGSNLEVLPNSNGLYNYEIVYLDGDITISPLRLQIIIDHLKKVYGSADPTFTYTMRKIDGSIGTVIDPENCPLNLTLTRTLGENVGKGDIVDGEHAGAYTITGTYDNPNYEVEIIDGSLTIVKAIITVTVDGGYTKVYGDPNPEFGVVYDGFIGSEGHPDLTGTGIHDDESVIRGDLIIECFDADGNPVDEKTHTGLYPVNDDKSTLEADNYEFRYVNGDLTITKKPLVVVVDDQEKIYGEEDPPTFTWHLENPEDLVDEDDIRHIDVTTERPDAGTEPGEQVGEHPITGEAEPMQDYEITVIPGTETIKPATIVVTALPDSKYYGEDNPIPEVTITGYKRGDAIDDIGGEEALVIDNEAEKWSPVGGGSMEDGKYRVSAEDSVFSNPNYEFVYIDGTLEILPLTIRIIVDDAEKVYGTFDPDEFTCHFEVADENGNPYEASDEQLEAVRTGLHLVTVRVPGEIVGQYPIRAGYTEVDNFIITSVDDGTFTITPAELVITANSAMKVYDGTPLTDSGYKAEGLVINETLGIHDTLESVTVTGSQTEVGKSPNVPSDAVLSLQNGSNGNRNYNITYVNGVLEVVPTEQVNIEKTADREITTDGEIVTYTIKVTNATLHDLTNVKVEDTNNFAGAITIPDNAEYSYDNGVFTIPSLPSAQNGNNSFEIVYTYTVRPEDHGTDGNDTLTNKAVITDMTITDGTEPDPDWFDETPDVDVDIIRHDIEVVKSADKEIAAAGDVVTYTISVTNTGNVQLNNIVVSDDNNFAGNIVPLRSAGSTYNEEDGTWTIAKLGVGVTVNIRYTYTVTPDDLPNEVLENVATGTVPPSDNIPEIEKPSNEVDVPLIGRSVAITKRVDKNQVYEGDTVTYTLHIVNDGTVDLSNLTVTDDSNALGILVPVPGTGYTYRDGKFVIDFLAVGESIDITYKYTVVQNDPTVIENIATVHVPEGDTGTDADDPFDVPSNPVEVEVIKDGLTVEKKAAESIVGVGEDIHYTIVVTNTGTTTLHNIVVKDTTSGAGETVNTTAGNVSYDADAREWTFADELIPGNSFAVTYTYTTVEADEVTGKVENTAVATGRNPGGNPVPSNPDDEDVVVSETPEAILDIEKRVDKETAMVGDVLTYTLHITNSGDATAYNVIVEDYFNGVGEPVKADGDGYTVMDDGNFLIPELAAGESIDITYTYTVQEGDKGTIDNIVVIVPEEPPVDIEKEADKNIAAVNEVVTYTITVTNTADEAKENLTVTDSNNFVGEIVATDGSGYVYNGDRTWTIAHLDAGASIEIVYTYTMQSEDASTIVNQADVTYTEDGEPITIESNPVEVDKPVEGEVTIVKSADKTIARPGEVVTYTVTVHNGKTVDAQNVVVTDANNFAGTITGVDGSGYRFENGQFVIDELKSGASVTLHYTYTVEPGDVPTELLKNIATAHVPGTNPEDPNNPGQGIDPEKPIDPDQDVPSNEVVVEVPGDETTTDIPEKGELVVVKTVDKTEAQVGDVLNYTVTVSNTGNGDLNDITVSDYFDGHGTLEYIPSIGILPNGDGTYHIAKLPAGATIELHFRYTVVEADIPLVLNAAVAEPNIPVEPEKSADKKFAPVNDVITYTITVRNNDTEAKENLTVTDTNNFKGEITPIEGEGYTYNGDHTWTIDRIEAGGVIEIHYTYTVQSDDETTLVNDANVNYLEDGGEVNIPTNTVTVEVPEPGHVTIHKEADKKEAKPGEIVTYNVTVHNGKDFDVHDVVVTDANNFAGEITGVDGADYRFENGQFIIDTIAAGADVTLTYTYTVEIADVPTHILDNIATAHVPGTNPEDPNNPGHGVDPDRPIDPDEDVPSNKVEVEVPGDETETEVGEGKLEITKTVDKTVASVGDTLQYTVTATNTGDAALENVTVEDVFGGHGTLTFVSADDGVTRNEDGTFSIASLGEGESKNIHFSYVVVEEDAPEVLNAAVIVPENPPVEPEKTADKTIAQVDEVVTYTIKVTNHDDEAKQNVLVTDTNNFAGEINATDGDGYVYNGDHTWTIAEIGAGETINIVYTYTVTTEDETIMTNEATIHYTDESGEHHIPADPVNVEKPEPGEVTIVKAADKTEAKPGEVVTYTVTLHNDKGFDIYNVEVTDTNNFAGSIEGQDGDGYRFVDGKFIIDELKAGESITLTYTYTVQIADVPTEILDNFATAFVPGTNPEDPENPGHGIDPDRPIDPDSEIPSNEVEVLVPGDSTETEIPEPEIVITKSVDKDVAEVGDTLNYEVKVSNEGTGDAENVLVKDFFGGHGTLNYISQNGVTDNGDGSYTIASVPAGKTYTLRFTYVVVAEDAPQVLNAAVEIPEPEIPVDPVKTADKNVAKVDEIVTYTIAVTNNDTVTKENLTVTDSNNFAGEINASNGDGYVYNGDGTWTIAKIEPGETIDIVYTYTVKTEDESTLVNQAEVVYTQDGEEITIPTNPVEVEKPEDGEITIVKSADKEVAYPNDVVTYQVTIHNGKPTDVHNVTMTDSNNFAGEISAVDGSGYHYEDGKFIIDTIPAGESVTLTYTYTVQIADVDTHFLKNIATAHVPGENPDDPGEDIPSNEVTVEVPGDETETEIPDGELIVEKTVDKATAEVGDTLNYTVKVSNTGDTAQENILIEDFFDGNGELNYIPTVGVTVNGDGTYSIARLPAHSSMTLRFTYTVVEGDAPEVLNAAVVTPEEPPVEPTKSADKQYAYVDEIITYTISVFNGDDEAKQNVIVTDNNNFAGPIDATGGDGYVYNGDHSWTIAEIGAGETVNITYTYTVREEDESLLTNTADVEYDEDGEHITIPTNPVDVPVIEPGSVTIHKVADKQIAKPGETITYNVTVHNGKDFDVHDVVVTDANNFAGEITGVDGADYRFENGQFVIDTIAAGADVTLTYTYTVEIADVPTHILENIATAHVPGTNPEDPNNPGHGIDPEKPIDPDEDIPSNEVEVEVPGDEVETEVPDISLTKTVDKEEAHVGDTLNYTVSIKNSGDADAENVLVKEFFGGLGQLVLVPADGVTDNGDGTYTVASVPAGTTYDIHFTYTVVQGDAPEVLNAAVIKDPPPPIIPEKDADKDVAKVDEVVTYTITVRNTTEETVTDLLVTDSNNFTGEITPIPGDGYTYNGDGTWTIAELAAGQTVEIRYTYTVQTDDPSTLLNQADVRYTYDGEDYNIPTEEVPVEVPEDGEVTIVKSADKKEAEPGETVTYTVTVYNGKTEGIDNVRVTDANNFAGTITGVDGAGYRFENGEFIIDHIDAGSSVTITYTYVVEIADVDTQILENVATAHVPSKDPNEPDEEIPSNPVDVEVPGDETTTEVEDPANMTVTKTADVETAKVGDFVNYTITVTNTGNRDIEQIALTDIFNGKGEYTVTAGDRFITTEAGFYIPVLSVGETIEIHYTYKVVEDDLEDGILRNVVLTSTPTPIEDPVPPVEEEVPIEHTTIIKTADKQTVKVGETIHYTVSVTNDGQVDLTNVLVKDFFGGAGEINAGNGDGYTYNGDETWTITELNIGETINIEYDYVVVAEDTSDVLNAVIVKEPDPPVDIEKSADKNVALVSEVVTYTIEVTNTTDEAVTDLTVTDHNNFNGAINAEDGEGYTYNGDGTWTVAELAAGETVTITYTYTVQTNDESTLINEADVKYVSDGETQQIVSEPVIVEVPDDGEVTIVKTADKTEAEPGEVVTYTVTVHNGKTVPVVNAVVSDSNNFAGEITSVEGSGYHYENGQFVLDEIPAGGNVVITYTYTVQPADVATHILENVATVKVPGTNPEDPDNPGHGVDPDKPIDPDEEIPSNPVDVEVPGDSTDIPVVGDRDLTIVKSADKEEVKPGEVINYTLTVTNTGSEDLDNVKVTDKFSGHGDIVVADQDGIIYNGDNMWTIEHLPVGAVIEIHYSYTALAEDADAIINVAVATIPGKNPEDPDNPGHGIDPNEPIDPDKDVPSNEVEIPVIVPEPDKPDEPTPTPAPNPTPEPEAPAPTPAPTFVPRDPSKTGVGVMASVLTPFAALGACVAGLFVSRKKKDKDSK